MSQKVNFITSYGFRGGAIHLDIHGYLGQIRALAGSGQATEHSYRPALEGLFKSIDDKLTVINEPKQSAVGAPDFVFARNGVSIGWCEAKDLNKDITRFGAGDYSREQKERYKKGLPNLIYTNGTDFEFIREGEVTALVSIADLIPTLPPRPEEFPRLELMLKDFSAQTPISIKSAKQLAQMMAGKSMIIKDIMCKAFIADKESGVETELTEQYEGFKKSLIHDITVPDFADVYAETIAYGLFAARLHDVSLDSFNRAEALELLPKSNPFLRNLFVYIAGNNLDDRLRRTIDDLCDVFRASDVAALMQDFGKFTARNDPFLHFYETFLAEYNPAKRKARGVWYTPEPVVNFIVRAVDDVLKTEFNLPRGIADTSKIQIDWDTGQNDRKTGKPLTIKKDVHRVQILDPATGTGTFLAEAIKQIEKQVKDIAPGMWSGYVEENLIPRLHGFELLMASYAMCHMKLDMMLTELGYKPSASPPRLGVYLTNSLEEGERVEQTLPFSRWLSEEAKGANIIKRDTPIMCVIGNPPYAVSSSNNSPFIEGLVRDYKNGLNERNIQPLSDDYIKFLRFSQHLIDKNSHGVLGFITNNSYLDGLIHRTMRKSLLDSFSSIYIVDLHGSTKRKEVAPDGSPDVNVFDIQQGVSIIIAVKNADKQGDTPVVRHLDLWGSRASKNESLFSLELNTAFASLKATEPNWYFVPKDFQSQDVYEQCFSVKDLMPLMSSGIKTHKDDFAVAIDSAVLEERIEDARGLSEEILREKYRLGNDVRDWKVSLAQQDVRTNFSSEKICKYNYRPFDARWTFLSGKTKGFLSYPRTEVMFHLQAKDNLAFNLCRQLSGSFFAHGLVSNVPIDLNSLSLQTKEQSYCAPLYLYPEEGTFETERRVNFDPKIYAEIRERAGLSGVDGDELKVFDYIYGVLHSPDYRATYAQFLKIDFPRIPYPASPEVFAHVAEKGGQLRRLHLMEDAIIGATPYPFSGAREGGDEDVVEKPAFALSSSPSTSDGEGDRAQRGGGAPPSVAGATATSPSQVDGEEQVGRVMINPDQYFDNVPALAWEFHIGGYQPAQKWLKDRKGRALSFDDVLHYQKIIKILTETDRIMKEIKLPL
jgi:type I restriction-modification system DNA methylase subunit